MRPKSEKDSYGSSNYHPKGSSRDIHKFLVFFLMIVFIQTQSLDNLINAPQYINSQNLTNTHQNTQIMQIKQQNVNYFTQFQFFSMNPSLSVSLQSNHDSIQNSKSIPIMKQSSCQLIVFLFYNGTFNITIQNIDQSIKNMLINFKALNITKQVCPYQGKIHVDVQTDIDQTIKLEITQYVTIRGFDQNNVQQFQQVRKVYLIRNSNQDWSYVTLPQMAILLTQILAFICIIILTKNIKYRRFTPLNFGFLFACIYSFVILVAVYIDDIVLAISPNSSIQNLQIPKYIVAFFAMVLITIYSMDILNFFLEKKIIIFSIAFIFSLALIIIDQIIFQDFWYVNNIIAILVSGCIVKFIVVRKIKASLLPLTILWIFSIVRQFVHLQPVVQQISLEIFPLHLQIPACFGDDPDGYSCSAFGSSKIIIMGLIISYAVRVDLFISSRFYEVLTLTTAFFCLLLQILFNFILDQIPVMQYLSVTIFLPLSISLMILFSNKRGQWAIIWHGSFYDMAVNRTSIRKSDKESITTISQTFGTGLLLSSNSSYSDGSLIQK